MFEIKFTFVNQIIKCKIGHMLLMCGLTTDEDVQRASVISEEG